MHNGVPSPKEYIHDYIVQQQDSPEDKKVLFESLEGHTSHVIWEMANELYEYISITGRVDYEVLHILLVGEENHI